MKKIPLTIAVTALYVLAGYAVHAQSVAIHKSVREPVSFVENKSTKAANDGPATDVTVSPKVLKGFESAFGEMPDVKWSNIDRKYDRAYFVQDGIAVRATFNKKGKLMFTLRYYTAEHLPNDVTSLIHSSYDNMNIFGIVEVSVAGKTAYLVDLEDKKHWLKIKVLDGEISEELAMMKR